MTDRHTVGTDFIMDLVHFPYAPTYGPSDWYRDIWDQLYYLDVGGY